MKTKEILNLDFRKEENKIIIQKVLRQIKPLSKYTDEIPIIDLEKTLKVLCVKYNFCQSNFYIDFKANKDYPVYKIVFMNVNKQYKIYGICLYELFAKSVIQIYTLTRKEK